MKILLLIAILLIPSISIADVLVITHPDNKNTLTKGEVRAIFLAKTSVFPDGEEILLISQPVKSDTGSDFSKQVLGKSPSQLKAYWSKLIFTGKAIPPKEVDSDSKVVKLVSNNKNTIGFVSSDVDLENVKVIWPNNL